MLNQNPSGKKLWDKKKEVLTRKCLKNLKTELDFCPIHVWMLLDLHLCKIINWLTIKRLNFNLYFSRNDNPEPIFEVSPKYILFNKYVIGKVYESTFEVRNISLVAHQMRAVPPKTPFFNLSLGINIAN